jgi:transglutaminase-like putative cysteine protease
MYYSIRHQTKFRYAQPVAETVMEVRVQPRTEWTQHCLSFDMQVSPRARVLNYRDHLGNVVHHFNVPAKTESLAIVATSMVDVQPFAEWPDRLDAGTWREIDELAVGGDYHDMLMPSDFAKPSGLLAGLAAKLYATRRDDPMTVLRQINKGIFESFEYVPKSTSVDSPIDDALRAGRGVCQDFAHIMITLVRQLGIPCRYVSGYEAPKEFSPNRAAAGQASHAWVEALLPGLGWVGFDPTNDKLVSDRHVRCAIGRDYADVPPTKGIYKGSARGELSVHVVVVPSDGPSLPGSDFAFPIVEEWITPAQENAQAAMEAIQQQQ